MSIKFLRLHHTGISQPVEAQRECVGTENNIRTLVPSPRSECQSFYLLIGDLLRIGEASSTVKNAPI